MTNGSSAWIVAADRAVGAELAAGVQASRRNAILFADGIAPGDNAFPVNTNSRDAMKHAFEEAIGHADAPELILFALVPAQALISAPVTTLDPGSWAAAAEMPARALMHGLQAVLAALGGRPVSIAVLGPTTGHVGAPGLVPLSTALEAQRGIVKSVARQWGERGVRLNWIGVAPEAWSATLAEAAIPHGPEMGDAQYALGRPAGLGDEVAAAATLLADPAARAITGATINIDGGEWMLP